MIIVENVGKIIHIFTRDSSGKFIHKIDNCFRPYFYVGDIDGKRESIFGDRVRRISCDEPKQVHTLRDNYLKHFEADVIYTNRYMIDKFDNIGKVPIRKCYLDIEIDVPDNTDFPDVSEANYPINSIACYDNFLKKYIAFVLLPPNVNREKQKGDKVSKYYFNSEKQLLGTFLNFIQNTNPDMLLAWNGDDFDFPYIINRIRSINKLDVRKLSRLGVVVCKKGTRGFNTIVKGRILSDLMPEYKNISQNKRESYSLEYISQYELNAGKDQFDGTLYQLYRKDLDKFVDYNIRDVELLKLLDEKLFITDFFDAVMRLAHCSFNDVFHITKIHDALFLVKTKNKKVVLPSKIRHIKDKVPEGAFVHDASKGLFNDIAVGDLKSLYPSCMITFNISPETILEKPTVDCINIDNKFFFKNVTEQKGIVCEIEEDLLQLRTTVKNKMMKLDRESQEFKGLNIYQSAIKVVANGLFGAMGNVGFRLFKLKILECILYISRRVIKHSIKMLEDAGIKVIYSDTDSIFFEVGNKTIEQCNDIINEITKSYDKFVKQFNVTDHKLVMEFEKVYKRILFTGVKKRYAGLIYWKDGKPVDEINIMGYENRRSDCPQVVRDFQKQLFEKILRGSEKKDILNFIAQFKQKFYSLKEQLGIPKGINKKIEDYGNVIHVRSARVANERHNAKFRSGDKIKYIYIKKQPKQFTNFENVIGFRDKLWDDYVIDYDKMWDVTVEKKIQVIKESIGWINKSANVFDFV